MTGLIWWTSILMEAGGLVFAKPGAIPSEYLNLRQLVLDEARASHAQGALRTDAAGGDAGVVAAKAGKLADPAGAAAMQPVGPESDAWETIARCDRIFEDVNAEVRLRFRVGVVPAIGDEGGADQRAFAPEALIGRPNGDGDPLERDAAMLGLSLLETRGFFDELAKLPSAAPGVCLDASERYDGLSCRRLMLVRRIGRVIAARLELAAQAGDAPRYLQCVEQHLALARIAGHQVGTIAPMLRPSMLSQLHRQIQADVLLGRVPSNRIAELAAILKRQAHAPTPKLWMGSDAAALRTFIAATHTLTAGDDGRLVITAYQRAALETGTARALANNPEPDFGVLDWPDYGAWTNAMGVTFATRKQALARAAEFETKLAHLATMSYTQQQQGAKDLGVWAESLPRREWVVRTWALSMADSSEALFRIDTDTRMLVAGMRTMLAIESFRSAKQRLPETLGELVPEFLIAVPSDPYADGPLMYSVTDPAATGTGTGYVLYSLWEDGKDNAGSRSAAKTQLYSTPKQRQGCDFVINDFKDAQGTR